MLTLNNSNRMTKVKAAISQIKTLNKTKETDTITPV